MFFKYLFIVLLTIDYLNFYLDITYNYCTNSIRNHFKFYFLLLKIFIRLF